MEHPKEFAEGLSIGIIMDGNGRWAKNRGLPRTAGHKKGAEVFSDIADYCDELGVSSVYFYAFSTENWKRPLEEVNAIMRLFWQKYLQPLLTDPSRPCAVLRPTVDWQHEAIEDMERAFRAVVNEIPGYEFKTRAALSEMIFQLVSHAPAVQAMPKKALRNADRIKTMLQFIQEHYAENISVEQVASSASISPSECLRCFHDMIGTTPNQYLRDQRAQRAAELLCGTGLRVTEIAMQCGFQDASYFARAFRQVYGCGPTEYRRKARREK